MHSPLLENNAACWFISASWRPSSPSESRALRGQNASQWWLCGCQEAACAQLCSVAGCQAPGSSGCLLGSTCFSPPCIGNVPSSPTPCCFPLHDSILPFPMADARCLPPSTCLGAGGWDGLVRRIPLPGISQQHVL